MAKHKVGVGIALGAIALGTGFGALLAGAGALGVVLGGIATVSGGLASELDREPCFQGHDSAACGGFWLGVGGSVGGLFGALGSGLAGLKLIAEGGAAFWSLTGAGAVGWEIGGLGFGIDAGQGIASLEGYSADAYDGTCANSGS